MAKEMVGLRLPQSLIDAVDVIAQEETRTRANAIERILTAWFQWLMAWDDSAVSPRDSIAA